MRYKILTPILVVALLSMCAVAQAQRQVNSYSPARPTISPYLYLTRPQQGPLPNYQTFVQPLQNQSAVNRTQQSDINFIQQTQQNQQLQLQQQQGSQQQQGQQQQQPQGLKIIPSAVAPTGIGASYNTLSHYYPETHAGGGQRGGGGRHGGGHSGGGGGGVGGGGVGNSGVGSGGFASGGAAGH